MLIYFYGNGCPHCLKMKPLVDELTQKSGVEIERLEVWNNAANGKKLEEYDQNFCGGVPFFYNTESGDYICGETTLGRLQQWAGVKDRPALLPTG